MESLEIEIDYLLHIVMDVPNVNTCFENTLIEERRITAFLSFGSCNLHTVNNGFGKPRSICNR